MKYIAILTAFLLFSCFNKTEAPGKSTHFIDLELNEANSGLYFILLTSGRQENAAPGTRLKFDANHVVYLDESLIDSTAIIRIFNTSGSDITEHMKNTMRSDFYFQFYNPTKKELESHQYVQGPSAVKQKEKLEQLGYVFEDSLIVNRLVKQGRYRKN